MPASASSLSALLPASATVPGPLGAADSIGLVQALRAVPDPRRRRGRRHGLQSVLLLALQAVMAGASSWVVIAQWAATAPQALGVWRIAVGGHVRRVLAAVDITAVEAALTTWVTGRQARARAQQPTGTTAAACRTVLAVDGKTLRGSMIAGGALTKPSASTTTPSVLASPRRRWNDGGRPNEPGKSRRHSAGVARMRPAGNLDRFSCSCALRGLHAECSTLMG